MQRRSPSQTSSGRRAPLLDSINISAEIFDKMPHHLHPPRNGFAFSSSRNVKDAECGVCSWVGAMLEELFGELLRVHDMLESGCMHVCR